MASLMETRRRILLNTPHLETLTDSLVSFDTDVPADLKEHKLYIEPIQDLHGYDHPWPEGGGKNLLQKGVSAEKAGITFSVSDDGTITVNGTSTATTFGNGGTFTLPAGTYILNGCPANSQGIIMDIRDKVGGTGIINGGDSGNGFTFTLAAETTGVVNIRIPNEVTISNLVFKPMIRLASVTDATFAPYSNICPISGRTGAKIWRTGTNIWDEQWELGLFNSSGQTIPSSTSIRCKNFIPVVPGTTYYMYNGSVKRNAPWYYDANQTFVTRSTRYYANQTFTIPDGCYYMKIALPGAYGATYKNDVSINYPSTDTEYHAYNPASTTIPINLGSAGTVYGGTLDVKSGVLVVDRAMVDLGTLAWARDTTNNQFENSASVVKTGEAGEKSNFVCSIYKSGDYGYNRTYVEDFIIWPHKSGTLRVRDSRYTDATTFKAAMSGVQLSYELATPITYQLTPHVLKALRGVNNIWSDTSVDTQVRFWTHKKEG